MPSFLKREKKVINNPDEVIISCINGNSGLVDKINETDAALIVKILAQFDINSICRVLAQLPDEKVAAVYSLFSSSKQKEIIKRLPSKKAAVLVRETISA